MIQRRRLTTLIAGAAATWSLQASSQPAVRRKRRIGIVMAYPEGDAEYVGRVRVLRDELARLGWSDGVNVTFDERWTTDDMNRVRAGAASLMAVQPDVVVAIGGRVVPVLMSLSRSIPIVVPGAGDPVGVGWVQSLARPGGNVTGFSFLELSIFGKMLETLKQIAPTTRRVAFIYNSDNPSAKFYRRAVESAAETLSVETTVSAAHGLAEIEQAIARASERPDGSVLFPPDITIQTLRQPIVAAVNRHRVPAMYSDAIFPRIGGLLYYGADRAELFRRAAGYVDRILRGEEAGELPFQQPTTYQLIINLKTAKALGIDVPPMLLARADEVIE